MFQKEAQSKRKTRKDLDKEIRDNIKEEEENYSKSIKFGESPMSLSRHRKMKKSSATRRKVSKEQLKEKLDTTKNQFKKLFNDSK